LAAKVLIVINRLRPRLKVLPSSLLLLATTSEKVVFVFVLPTTKTTFREEEEEQEEEDNARISFLSDESRKVPQVSLFFSFLSLGFYF
jgi:hypothetical protein|tara:strand:- start:292 stop:555 length:264 start_codon:yes stop_codon:yes gene_type:complete